MRLVALTEVLPCASPAAPIRGAAAPGLEDDAAAAARASAPAGPWRRLAVAAASLVLAVGACGCAKTGRPGGGPPDDTAPRVVDQWPPADATQVPLHTVVEIRFSEAMDEEATAAAAFVAPAAEARVRCRGDRLQMAVALRPERTYVITVGTDARDRRGNRLKEAHMLAFATGEELDRGQVAGTVFREHVPADAAHVWAFDLGAGEAVSSERPQYRTQTGRDGAYVFARLAPGRYRVVAFLDSDGDRRPGQRDWLALPAEDLEIAAGDTVRAGDLLLGPPAAVPVTLERLHVVDDQRLLLEFSAPVRAAALELELAGLAVLDLFDSPVDPRRVLVRTAPQERGRKYAVQHLRVHGLPVSWEAPVRGAERSDRTPPRVVRRLPEESEISADDTLAVVFDEPMDARIGGELWVAADSAASPPAGIWCWQGPSALRFVPAEPLPPGRWRWGWRLRGLADLAGNAPADSVVWFERTVLGRADLGAIEGRVVASAGPLWVTGAAPHREYRAQAGADGTFVLAGLVPAEYVLHAFVDRDGDGRHTPGSLDPYRPAEPYCRWPDPVPLAAGARAVVGLRQCR